MGELFATDSEARYTRLAQAVSPRLGHARGKTTLSCFLTLSRRSASLHYPERAQELFNKAEATAKAKYERLKKLVDFYNVD